MGITIVRPHAEYAMYFLASFWRQGTLAEEA